jgi:solute carrier family 36 (proton-coupled amino acid transporter)
MIVSEHLVKEDEMDAPVEIFGSVSHALQGGAVTREIYKWQEDNVAVRPRRMSAPSISSVQPTTHASDLMEPGMFRRQFLQNRALALGRPEPPFLTRNFIDFLVLYGFYGGDVLPEDETGNLV